MSTRTLTTTLPSGTLYVSGTVNGVSTTWTNTEGNTWETVAERSPQDVYVVALTIINQLGTATETTFTLYYGLHLVTDRTAADHWTSRWAFPLARMLDKPVKPGDTFFANATRVMSTELCDVPRFGIFTLCSHTTVHTCDRSATVTLEK